MRCMCSNIQLKIYVKADHHISLQLRLQALHIHDKSNKCVVWGCSSDGRALA